MSKSSSRKERFAEYCAQYDELDARRQISVNAVLAKILSEVLISSQAITLSETVRNEPYDALCDTS